MTAVGDALADVALGEARDVRAGRARRLRDWLARLTRPPIGVRLICDDGGKFSGLVIVDANRPIAMLALRVGDAGVSSPERPYMRPAFDESFSDDVVERYR